METTEKPSLKAAMVGFWFGIGVILAAKMVLGLEYCIEELISRKCQYNGRRKSSNNQRPEEN